MPPRNTNQNEDNKSKKAQAKKAESKLQSKHAHKPHSTWDTDKFPFLGKQPRPNKQHQPTQNVRKETRSPGKCVTAKPNPTGTRLTWESLLVYSKEQKMQSTVSRQSPTRTRSVTKAAQINPKPQAPTTSSDEDSL